MECTHIRLDIAVDESVLVHEFQGFVHLKSYITGILLMDRVSVKASSEITSL